MHKVTVDSLEVGTPVVHTRYAESEVTKRRVIVGERTVNGQIRLLNPNGTVYRIASPVLIVEVE